MLNKNLEENKIYRIFVDIKGNEGYGDSDPYECWSTEYVVTLTCTKNITLNEDIIFELVNNDGYNVTKLDVTIEDITELFTTSSEKLKILKDKENNFDWNNKDYDEFELITDEIYEIENKLYPNYAFKIDIEKTI